MVEPVLSKFPIGDIAGRFKHKLSSLTSLVSLSLILIISGSLKSLELPLFSAWTLVRAFFTAHKLLASAAVAVICIPVL